MATQSISSVASLPSRFDSSHTNDSVQRQDFAVDVAETKVPDTELSQEAVEKVVSQISAYVQNTQRDMDFIVDDSTGDVVVKVVDSVSDEVIRQIPSEEVLARSHHYLENLDMEQTKGFLIELEA